MLSDRHTPAIFQFTPLREGRRLDLEASLRLPAFQFTPLREGRRLGLPERASRKFISIHAPPRGATCSCRGNAKGQISIHAPPRGATRALLALLALLLFQFTPLREGRHVSKGTLIYKVVFQFTPLREGRPAFPTARNTGGIYFNSRPSARGDAPTRTPMLIAAQFQFTPLREGRLPRRMRSKAIWLIFQFTPLREGRRKATKDKKTTRPFQFTPLREGRLRRDKNVHCTVLDFNSRPSARGDLASPRGCHRRHISIHAPPRGATPEYRPHLHGPIHFNSRPSARGDCASPRRPSARRYFNSRPSARGDRRHYGAGGACRTISIHAPPRGATALPHLSDGARPISIHAPPRGATRSPGERRCTASFQFTPLREGRRQKICNFCKSFVQPLQISMA